MSSKWIQTWNGYSFDLLEPRPQDINIEVIAHALSNQCRFGGHCSRFYSVAQHSVWVSHECEPENALWGLLHDATEAYLGDVVSPLKKMREMAGYRDIENKIHQTIAQRFSLPINIPRDVHDADCRVMVTEAYQLMQPMNQEWQKQIEKKEIRQASWAPWYTKLRADSRENSWILTPDEARRAFLERYWQIKVYW